jgi:hypothetical protein
MPLDITSSTEQKVPILFAPKTSSGKPATIDGAPVLSVTSGGALAEQATPEELATGIAGYIVSEDIPGTSTWQIKGDADLGQGVREIVDGGSYVYNDPEAENFGLSAGTAVPK